LRVDGRSIEWFKPFFYPRSTNNHPHSSANFSVKEKDEASLANDFRQDSPNAFILRLAGGEGFLLGWLNRLLTHRFADSLIH
jgi:hypothetical protein